MLLFLLGLAQAADPVTETVGSEPAWHTAAQRCFPANIGEWALLTARDYQNALGEFREITATRLVVERVTYPERRSTKSADGGFGASARRPN